MNLTPIKYISNLLKITILFFLFFSMGFFYQKKKVSTFQENTIYLQKL